MNGQKQLKNIEIILCSKPRLITDENEQQNLIKTYHNSPLLSGHCGQKRLLKKFKSYYTWRRMSRDVADFCRSCKQCQFNKAQVTHTEPMCITTTSQNAFDTISIDTIGPFPKTNAGNVYAVTMQCDLTKYVVNIPIPDKTAKSVAKAIFENFILIFGPMLEIRTDMGTEYINEVIKALTQLLQINHRTSTPYHSQTMGGCERNHRVLNEFLRSYINDAHDDWDLWLPFYTFCYNTTPHTITNYTPYELVFGKLPNLSNLFSGSKVDPVYDIDNYYQELRYRLQLAHKRAQNYIQKAKALRKVEYDKRHGAQDHTLCVNDLVLLSNDQRQKMDPWFKGPFKVTKIDGVNYTIQNNEKTLTVHGNRIKPFHV